MTKEEMAQQFAEQNAEDVKEMLRRAFLKGYNQVALQTAHSISIDGVEYYDMGLPSGTLWSEPLEKEKGRYEMMPYIEASKYDGLPTIEQWEELKNTCMVHDNEIIGITGKRITIEFYVANSTYGCPPQRGEKVPDNEAWFWLKSEIDEEGKAATGIFHRSYDDQKESYLSDNRHFAGYRLPVMLTKKKEDNIEK